MHTAKGIVSIATLVKGEIAKMTRNNILRKSTPVSEISTFEDFYENLVNEAPEKARKLQLRRWRQLKRQLM